MKEIIEKISSYNIFNYLFPGVIFTYLLSKITTYNLMQEEIIVGLFVYYFIGLIISRIGSVIIEPILKKIKFLKFSDYKDFVITTKEDENINLFSEINNMYRTIISMFLNLMLLKLYSHLETQIQFLKDYNYIFLIVFLLILFLFSYRKQTNYITKRVEANKKKIIIETKK